MEKSSNNSSSMHPPFNFELPSYISTVGFVIVLPNIAGNILCCVVIAKTKSLHNFCNFLLVNLAISDMSSGLILLFVSTYTVLCSPLRKGEFTMMKVQLFIHPMIEVSILNVTVISVERFFAITQPFKVMKKGRTKSLKYIIPLVWILGFVLTIPVFVTFLGKSSIEDVQGIQGSKELMADGIVYLVSAYIAPLSLMFITYFRILFALRRRNQPFTSQLTISRSRRANRRVWKLLGAVILSHNTCFLPYAIVQFLVTQPFGYDMREDIFINAYYGTFLWQLLSPCLNPLIYFGHSSVFRDACRSIVCRSKKVKP